MAALEGGVGAIATASGQAALHLAIATLMGAGSHIVACRSLYGGSHNLLGYTLAALRHRHDLRRPARPRRLASGRSGRTRGCCSARRSATPASTCSTSRRSRRSRTTPGLPLLVDSTFTTPYLMKPFDHGADLLYHSATKFLGGHGVAIGGVLVDGGTLRLGRLAANSRRSPSLTTASTAWTSRRSRHRRAVPAARAARRPARLRRLHGADDRVPDPAGHRDAAAADAAPRREHAQGGRVPGEPRRRSSRSPIPNCPRIPTTRWRRRLLPRGCGAVFSFDIKGGRAAGRASSSRCRCSRTSPTSATRSRW